MRYAGLRVGEVAALQGPDLVLSRRRGTVIVRRGKGLKHREIPLVLDARDPLLHYQDHRRQLAERWAARARLRRQAPPAWSCWPEGRVFLGQRGPLTERGIRDIVAKIGQAAKLDAPLSPHDLRHTFATAPLDPAAYGLDRPPLPLTAVQDLLGHADPATTAIYTKASPSDLARMLGEADE
jgi:site-specific recombinase XerD